MIVSAVAISARARERGALHTLKCAMFAASAIVLAAAAPPRILVAYHTETNRTGSLAALVAVSGNSAQFGAIWRNSVRNSLTRRLALQVYSREMVDKFASAVENAELRHEFGQCTFPRKQCEIPKSVLPPDDELTREYKLSAQPDAVPTSFYKDGEEVRTQDPTRAKPLLVLLWLRLNLARMVAIPGVKDDLQVRTCSEMLDELVVAYNGVDKIDKSRLPLPYCQLLKIFQIFFVFTLPFVIAPVVGVWTPVVAVLCAVGFFGLDQVGVELEDPFGVDHNDFPLLRMGHGLCNDLDAMVRTVNRERMQRRVLHESTFTEDEKKEIGAAAYDVLGWAADGAAGAGTANGPERSADELAAVN